MKLLSEAIKIPHRRERNLLAFVILSTFLLLLLYHKDVWRPVQYWLLVNGSILFIIPLLSLTFFTKKKSAPAQISAAALIAIIIALLFVIDAQHVLFSKMKQLSMVLPVGGIMIAVTACVLFWGRIDIRETGMRVGKIKFWLPITVIFFAFMVPIIYWASTMPEFQKTYPMLPLAKKGAMGFIAAEISFGVFFIFWEYFFRGYMLFVLEKRTGFLIANLLQATAFAFMHLGKPELEVYSSLAGGLIIGWLCYRSRSFLPAFFIHWGIQTAMDLFAVVR
jgi:membrane protease YdiL (CAAX protease family)